MNLTPKQFESTLRRVVRDETGHLVTKTEFDKKIDGLMTSIDSLTYKIDSFLTKEWNVHLHDAHPRIEGRLKRLEKKLNIN